MDDGNVSLLQRERSFGATCAERVVTAALSREVLEARVARERVALADAIGELRTRARAELELGTQVRERPSVWLGGALLLEFWLGARR